MKVRRVSFAFVSAAFLAAFATNGSPALASSSSAQLALTRDAYQALQAGNADAAIASYTEAINSRQLEKEVLANALLNRALAYQQKSADQQAIADYTQALALDSMSPALRATALYNRGLSRQKTSNLPGAVEDFTSALLLNPEFAHAYYGRATALRDSGQLLFALSDYERAIQNSHPDLAKVNYGLALTYIALHRPIDARRALASVLAVNPEHQGALAEMAKLNTSENAAIQDSDADPILTGSVTALGNHAAPVEQGAAKAVDVPAAMQSATGAAKPKKPKKYTDRVPSVENANYAASSGEAVEVAKVITVDEVPAVPPPENKLVTVAATAAAAADAAAPAEAPEPAAEETTASIDAAEPVAEQPSGYMVQIASASTEDAAWSTFKKMQKSKKVLQGLDPIVVKADLGTKGTFYRVRLRFDEQSAAASACKKLKAGGVQCFVSKS
ncbi:MAG: SPOR domain-containing protein [Rhizobiales bacterium]|nr:SPOR domain-containing protein [Hyphomicrobiales bacterium]